MIIIGAGICGISSAIWLQRAGREVIVIDKTAPGMGASFGNSGLIAQWAIAPVTSPELWRDAPRYLADRYGPLFLKWADVPGMLPWLARFLSNTSDAKTRRIVGHLHGLAGDAVEQHKSLVRGTTLEHWVNDSKVNYVYPNEAAFKKDAYTWGLKQAHGISPDLITGRDVHDEEPILSRDITCVAQISGQGHITDPGGYVTALAAYFASQGGKIVQAEVRDLHKTDGKVDQVLTDVGAFDCSEVVISAGIWSKDLMKNIGLSIPMQAERGYHVVFENPSQLPRNPMLMTEGKFGVNPMQMGLRCSGTVELGSHHSAASDAPLKAIYHHAKRAFPKLTYSGTTEWMGFRPSTCDSLPVIGQIGDSGIFTAFGHQHIGLTTGPKTGRIISQLITDTPPNADIAVFAPARFGL